MAKAKKPNTAALVRAAKDYGQNLMARTFLVVGIGKHGDVKAIELRFAKGNFQHLTGVKTLGADITPDEFFDRCIEGRLAESDIAVDAKGHVALKLRAAKPLFSPGFPVTAFGRGNSSHLLLSADEAVGSKAGVLGLKLVGASHVPISLLDANIRDEVTDIHSVVAVFSKRLGERYYSSPDFARDSAMGRPVNWEKVRSALSQEHPNLILPDKMWQPSEGCRALQRQTGGGGGRAGRRRPAGVVAPADASQSSPSPPVDARNFLAADGPRNPPHFPASGTSVPATCSSRLTCPAGPVGASSSSPAERSEARLRGESARLHGRI